MTEKQIADLENIVAVQKSDGNWNFNSYMHGMANGLILALAIVKDHEPKYLEAPAEWLENKSCALPDAVSTHIS